MRFSTRLLLALMAIAFACASASAALQAALPDGSGSRSWEMISVECPPVSGDVDVSVQDARGGPEIVRHSAGNGGRTWLPLPVVAPSELAGPEGGAWPIVVTLRSSARIVDQVRVPLALGQGGNAGSPRRLASTAPVPGFDGVCVIVLDQDILAAPALVFAGCDLLFLTPDLQARITRERALELLAVGARLAAPSHDASPPPGSSGGALATLVWEKTHFRAGGAMWITAARSFPRPAVLEPALGHIAANAPRPIVPAAVTTALILTGPLALILLALVRGLFRARRTILAGSALSMVALAVGVVLYLHTFGTHQTTIAQWRMAAASRQEAVGGLMLDERLGRCTALFRTTVNIKADGPGPSFPVAGTVDQYWALRGVQLKLGGDTQLCGTLPARSMLSWESRAAEAIGLLPAYPRTAAERVRLWESLHVTPAAARWLIGGYVKPAESPDERGVLFASWAVDQTRTTDGIPQGGKDATAWYDMRFEPGHRYLLWQRAGIMNVVDFGLPSDAAEEIRPDP